MKKKFTFLIAALCALIIAIALPEKAVGQEKSGKAYARISSLSELSNGCKIVFAIRYNNTATDYKAMGNTISGKISTTAFTSTTLGTYEIAPTSITNEIDSYYWTVSISNSNYSFTGANNKKIGWSSGANFANGSGTQTWALSSYKTNNGGMVGGYTAWKILNTGSSNKRCFALNNSNPQTVGPYDISTNASSSSYNFAIDIFVEKDTYTLSYNGNNNDEGTAPSSVTRVSGTSVTINGNTGSLTRTGFTFGGWCLNSSGTGTIYGPDEGQTHSITLTGDVELFAKWIPNSDYITVAPSPNNVTCASGSAEFTTSTNIASPSYAVQFYTTSECNVTSERPAWLGSPSFGDGTLSMSVSENTNSARSAYFKVYSGTTYSNVVTINQAAITVLPPTFNHGTGTYYENQSITLTNQTDGASIYYTMGANPDDPTSSSTPYSGAISVTSTTTIKAIAIKNGVSSSVVTATYTFPTVKTVAEARAYPNTTDFFYTRGVVTYVVGDGKTAYIQDETAAIAIYKNDNSFTSGLSVGDEIVVYGKKTTYHGLVEVGTATIVTTLSTGNTVSPTVKTVAAINSDYGSGSGDNNFQSMFVKIEKATYNGSNSVTQSGSSITVEGAMGSAVNGDAVTFTGIIGCYDAVKIINLGNVEIVNDPFVSVSPSTALPFSYIVGNGPSATQTFTVTGTYLTDDDIIVSVPSDSDFEIKTGAGEYTNSLTLASGDSFYVRMKSGKTDDEATYSTTLTIENDGADEVNIALSGSVSYLNVKYNGNGVGVTDVPTDAANYTYNASVTVLGEGSMARTGYDFVKWNTKSDGTGQDYVENGTFNITEDVTLYAQWAAKSYSITADPAITHGNISFTVGGAAAATAQTGQTVTIVPNPDSGYGLSSVSVNSGAVTVTNNTFVMPASPVTVSATFVPTVTDIITASTLNISGGSYTTWTGKTFSSEAVYAGCSYPTSKIQLKSKDNVSGIVTTATGGKIKKIKVIWDSGSGTLDVYGRNSAYSAATNLYNASSDGTKLGSINYTNSSSGAELEINNDTVTYIGLRSNSGTIYISQIEITWVAPTYALAYDANGGTGSMTDPSSPYIYNTSVTVLAKANTITAPSGKMFSKWNARSDGTGKDYAPVDTLKMPKHNKTLYAIWEDECNETATMAATSGTKEYVNDAGELSFKINLSSKVTALSGCADITEYGFVYSTNGTTPTVGDANCTKIVKGTEYTTANTVFEHELTSATLGATYKICSYATNLAGTAYGTEATVAIDADYPSYTIRYSTNGTSEASTTKIYQGNAISDLITPTPGNVPAGYTFRGWFNGDYALSNSAPTFVKNGDAISANLTLKAVFAIGTTAPEDVEHNMTFTELAITSVSGYHSDTSAENDIDVSFTDCLRTSGYIQMKATSGEIHNTEAIGKYITKIDIDADKNASNVTVYEGSSSSSITTSITKQNGVYTFSGNTQYFKVGNNGTYTVVKIKVYYKQTEDVTTYSNYCTSVSPQTAISGTITEGHLTTDGTIAAGTAVYLTSPLTINSGFKLTVNGAIGNINPANLIIEDGGQLILHNSGVQATIKKTVTASAKNPTNWYTIASPVRNVNIGAVGDAGSVNNLKEADGKYDLYRFNETKHDSGEGDYRWENYKNSAYHDGGDDDFIRLETGRGYLYRREGTATLEYVGEVNGNASETYNLTVAGAAPLTGFHLIGNPYSHDIYKGAGAAIDDSKLNEGFYRLTNGTAWTPVYGYKEPIHSGEGILVQANDGGTLTISNSTTSASGESKYNNDNIMFSVANSQHEDVAYAVFDKGHGLNKIEHRDASIPMLYISQNGENYAIAMMSDDTKTFDLSLKVKTMGQYTLSYKTTGEFSYLHVIDRLTGEDVDMLLEGEYSFVASPNDNDARFIVKLAYLPDYSDGEGDIFAYQNGSDIFVSGEGELQIFDVMGRFVMSERINGVKTISADELSKGVYVLRLVGNGMKTQKIVVK